MAWPVLLMARALNDGGSERQMTEIAKNLDRSRFEPRIGCFRPEGIRREELDSAGVPIIQFPVYSFASPPAVFGAWRLARYIRRNRVRLVHTFDYPLTAFAIPISRFFTRTVVVSSQRSHRDLIPGNYLRAIRITDRLADAIVVNCDFIRRHLEQDEHVPSGKIQLCYNGIDLDVFRQQVAPRPPDLAPHALVIGIVCVLRPEKGLSILLNAFARIRNVRSGMKLVIVGSGAMLEPLQAEVRTLGIFGECVFVPETGQVVNWLRSIDIFVLPSLTEALSNSLMEAMACGCCAVASNVGGNPELIRNGETGLLFESGDVAGLSDALRMLIENEPLRKQIGAAGARFIRGRFALRGSVQ
ncbi:MAG TPA: glycosyltransferase family 4 protein, partial [Bryobacteraceae bacterium]|nr:glycosyltransferase family 4 protein [Bryobacteraceae bacterium]